MASWLRALVGVCFLAAVLGLALLSLLAGVLDVGPVLSVVLLAVDVRLLLWLAVGIFLLGFLLYLVALRREDPAALAVDGPSVEALVPVHRDASVLHRSVEALLAAEYEDLAVTVVTEPDDEASRARADELAAEHDRVSHLVNEERRGSKAGALNAGIEASDAAVLALFDADHEPHPRLVPHAIATMTDDAGDLAADGPGVARVRSLPDPAGGLLEAMAYYEYLLLYFLPQKVVRALLGMAVAGTRSVLVRRSVFDAVGPFAEGHLAEDLDFTHRCHQADVDIAELLYYPTVEEPTHTFRDWWGQRVRWMAGQVAVSGSHLRDWRALLDPSVLGSVLTLVGTLVAGVLLSMTVPKVALGLATSPLVVGAGLAALYGVCLATRLVDNRTAGTSGVGVAWLLMPVTLSLFGLVIVQVVLAYAFDREVGWHSVEKGV
jgi:cellulose synthase/poly-beta-1,6-N-acetylglucosamine synthase-like glycosyltransferase